MDQGVTMCGMPKTLIEEKVAIFEPFMGKQVKIKITVVEQGGVYRQPLQIIVLAGRLIGVEGDVSRSMVNVALDTMQVYGKADPLTLNFGDSPMPKVEIEALEWQR